MLAREARAIERAADDETNLVVVERLRDVVLRAGLHRLDGDFFRAVRGHEDHRAFLGARLRRREHVHAAEMPSPSARSVSTRSKVRLREREALFTAAGDDDVVALFSEERTERELDRAFVLDDQDALLHEPTSSSGRRGNTTTNSAPSPAHSSRRWFRRAYRGSCERERVRGRFRASSTCKTV